MTLIAKRPICKKKTRDNFHVNKLGVVDSPLATPQRDKIVLRYLNITSSKIINARLMYDRQWTAG